ncbi:tripartite-type tricarboxylate transporter receptor subunit TctC [Variovorax sp. W1I1]|uniref:Bug family tripartite tricarboxylate transporter substrate binding protein n=1 Tax=Variovorax sp. W1I1 TaxID=3042309 RepID=UPI00277FB199|nr:tripartite tricarboxylate transporter substrate binding protein [Variovorax sp. W1I1]MDQ0610939.1 tripartite-type tricarboxylate transporter receptor subunit TctC [Variovorax sp. W1I1]
MILERLRNRKPPPVPGMLAAAALLSLGPPALAQTAWQPDRPVTLVVPYSAGGGTDATARAVSKQLGVIWKQPVVVENMPGADGLIGTRRVMEARPDGYTLLLQVPSIVVTKYTPGLKGIDPLARLEPVTAVSQSPAAVVVSAKLPVKTFGEFVQYCKTAAQPCSLGTGESTARISAKQLAAEAGLPNLIVVNYRGTGAIVTDMIANNVNMAFTGITAALPHYKAGTLKILATQGPKRAAALPEVPTTAEAGYPQFQSVTWFGLFAPKGTPASVTQGIVAALREAVKDTDVQKTIAAAGAEPVVNAPAAFAAQVRHESDRLAALVKLYPLE